MTRPRAEESTAWSEVRRDALAAIVTGSQRAMLAADPELNRALYDAAQLQVLQFSDDSFETSHPRAEQTGFVLPKGDPNRGSMLQSILMRVGAVGEYGASHQRRLALAAEVLMECALDPALTELCFSDAIDRIPLARKNDPASERTRYPPAQRTLVEGVLTTYQSLTMLTAERVEGFDASRLTGMLLRAATGDNNGMLARFAASVPGGFVGPHAQRGHFIANAVQRTRDGVCFSDSTESLFVKGTGGCPVARESRDVQRICTLYAKILDRLPEEV